MKKILFLFLLLTIIPLVSATTVDRLTPCDAQNACEEGLQCARLPAYETPVCVEDPCIEAGCTGMFQECVIMESYPIQVMCTGPDIPWVLVGIVITLLLTIGLGIYAWKNKDKKSKKSEKENYKNIKNLGIIFTIIGIATLFADGDTSIFLNLGIIYLILGYAGEQGKLPKKGSKKWAMAMIAGLLLLLLGIIVFLLVR